LRSPARADTHVLSAPDEAHVCAFGGLRRTTILADHDGRTAFGLALKQPMIALEDAGRDARFYAPVGLAPESDLFRTNRNRYLPG
jgi:hypothetical protein